MELTAEATIWACREWKRTLTKKFRLCATCDQDPLKQTLNRCEACGCELLQQLRKSSRRPVHALGTLRTAMLGGGTATSHVGSRARSHATRQDRNSRR